MLSIILSEGRGGGTLGGEKRSGRFCNVCYGVFDFFVLIRSEEALFLNVRVGSGVCRLGCWVGVCRALYCAVSSWRGLAVMGDDWVGMGREGGGHGTTCTEPV